eukprot:TRINITY_DN1220_c0_g1_i3.p1 TRINITY_DN1220_c0_g1~~TRINITY_DN1220_c0_g1_i3.p1  ORF type:complete len:225 (-),score=78.93 TRINITY_DN1220_c0_g1_i3:699-1373(-)
METKYLTSMKGWLSNNPNSWVAEERQLNELFGIQEAKMAIKRFQRMIAYWLSLAQKAGEVFKFKYPRFSYFFLFLSALAVLFFNADQVFCYVLAAVFVLFVVSSRPFCKNFGPLLEKYFFREELRNEYARVNIKTPSELEDEFLLRKIYTKELDSTKSTMTKKAEKLKKKKGLFKTFKKTYLSFLHTLVVIADMMEKVKKYCVCVKLVFSCGRIRRELRMCFCL